MSQFSEYRHVWVAEDSDGRPLRSAIERRRLNDKSPLVIYVPSDVVASALDRLTDGDAEGAIREMREALKWGEPK